MTATLNRPAGGRPVFQGATWARSFGFMLAFMLVISSVQDIQGIALLPLIGKMAEALSLTPSEISWAINATNIASAVVLGLSARSADIIGHRKVLIPLVTMGFVGAVLSAIATNFETLLAGRILLGLAVAAPMSWAMLKIRSTEPGLEKAARYNASTIAIMTPVGLVLGGLFLKWGASWNSVFWLVAVGYIVMFLFVIVAPETPVENRTHTRLDWLGALLLGAWLVSFLIGLNNGPSWGWDSGKFIGFTAAGVILFGVWIIQQRLTPNALIDFKGMDKRQTFAGYALYCSIMMTSNGIYILLPIIAQTPSAVGYGLGVSVLASALALSPILPGTYVASSITKRYLPVFGPRPLVIGFGAMLTLSFVWYAFFHGEYWHLLVGTAIFGIGTVGIFNIAWALVSAAGRQDNMSITTGIQYAIAFPTGTIMATVILLIQGSKSIPGTAIPAESTFVTNFYVLAIVAFVMTVLVGLFAVPRRIGHQAAHQESLDLAVASAAAAAATTSVGSPGVGERITEIK